MLGRDHARETFGPSELSRADFLGSRDQTIAGCSDIKHQEILSGGYGRICARCWGPHHCREKEIKLLNMSMQGHGWINRKISGITVGLGRLLARIVRHAPSRLINGVWAVPAVLLIRSLRPIVFIRMGTLESRRIGHFVADGAEQAARCFDEKVGSTDDEETIDIAVSMGVSIPFLRPAELARDDTSGIEPVLHTLSLMRDFDSVVLLQPKSPLRTSDDIEAIVDLANVKQASSAVSVRQTKEPIEWNFTIQAGGNLLPLLDDNPILRRQDAQTTYTLNGALYYFEVPWFLEGKKFLDDETLGFSMPPERSIHIDTKFDWVVAELLLGRTV